MTKYILSFLILTASSCGSNSSQIRENTQIEPKPPKIERPEFKEPVKAVKSISLAEIDLSKIGHIAPAGRIQDKEENQLKVVEDLIANGKDSIPFLISKLSDNTKIEEPVVDFGGEITVGDVAHIILSDFFLREDSQSTTIKGVGFYEFLDCKSSKETPANNCLYEYIEKHGRKSIKAKWLKIWEQNKDKIYWDENERCFKLEVT